jgi:hypothetical protein
VGGLDVQGDPQDPAHQDDPGRHGLVPVDGEVRAICRAVIRTEEMLAVALGRLDDRGEV